MVSILLSVLLAVAAALSAGIIVATVKQYAGGIRQVWRGMRECRDARDVHFMVTDFKVVTTARVLRPEFGTRNVSPAGSRALRAAA